MNLWYCDDGAIIGKQNEVKHALDILHLEGQEVGLVLNPNKCERYWPSTLDEPDPFPLSFVRHPLCGVSLLGASIRPDEAFHQKFLSLKTSQNKRILKLLPELEDSQLAFSILRLCASFTKVSYAIRTVDPAMIRQVLQRFDFDLRTTADQQMF